MQLFYNEFIEENSTEINFDKEESKHIVKVLRKHLGDTLFITNGKGWLFEAIIESDNEKKCTAIIRKSTRREKHSYHLHLAVAPTKMNERYEWFLEKATEIGIDQITPIICEHSERISIKIERFERVILSAMKQSLQTYKPHLNQPVTFAQFMKKNWNEQKFIAHCEKTNRTELAYELQKSENNDILILIGPEGDFSPTEINDALAKDFLPISLGNNRLRTETAAIVACNIVSILKTITHNK